MKHFEDEKMIKLLELIKYYLFYEDYEKLCDPNMKSKSKSNRGKGNFLSDSEISGNEDTSDTLNSKYFILFFSCHIKNKFINKK